MLWIKEKVEKSILALGSEERVQVAILNRVIRVDLIEKVTFKQSGKGIRHMATCGKQMHSC